MSAFHQSLHRCHFFLPFPFTFQFSVTIDLMAVIQTGLTVVNSLPARVA